MKNRQVFLAIKVTAPLCKWMIEQIDEFVFF